MYAGKAWPAVLSLMLLRLSVGVSYYVDVFIFSGYVSYYVFLVILIYGCSSIFICYGCSSISIRVSCVLAQQGAGQWCKWKRGRDFVRCFVSEARAAAASFVDSTTGTLYRLVVVFMSIAPPSLSVHYKSQCCIAKGLARTLTIHLHPSSI